MRLPLELQEMINQERQRRGLDIVDGNPLGQAGHDMMQHTIQSVNQQQVSNVNSIQLIPNFISFYMYTF
jgi:hypothetical protein